MLIDRNTAYLRTLRSQRKHAIKRKEKIAKNKFFMAEDEYAEEQKKGHFVRGKPGKRKVHCSCKMCRHEKRYKIKKHTVKSKLDLMQSKIDEYV